MKVLRFAQDGILGNNRGLMGEAALSLSAGEADDDLCTDGDQRSGDRGLVAGEAVAEQLHGESGGTGALHYLAD
jgi:hypothetical protein